MTRMIFVKAGMALVALVSAAAAQADVLPFSERSRGWDWPVAMEPARSLPQPTASSPPHRPAGASGPINGTFNLYLGANTLFGSITGLATPTGVMGITPCGTSSV